MTVDRSSKSSGYISIEELYNSCHVPGSCGKKMDCEGEIARVKGYVDYENVFDKRNYPQLPYEKFKIYDKRGQSVEVWTVSDDNNKIFEKIYQNKISPEKMAFIEGTIIGFDMPAMGVCRRSIKMNIDKESDIFFEQQ